MSTKTQKCPYCGAGWAGKKISSRHVSACAKRNSAAQNPATDTLRASTTPTVDSTAETTTLDGINTNYGKMFATYENIVPDSAPTPTAPEYAATNAERRARIRREVEEKPLMNYKFAYCPDCGQQIRVNTTRNSTFAVPHSGCPYGHLYREAEYDFDRMCAEVIIGEDEGAPLNRYTVAWREEQIEVFAENSADAQKLAMEELKPAAGNRKVHPDDVTLTLTEQNGMQVTHASTV